MPFFQRKVVTIEAVQFTGVNYNEVFNFAGHLEIGTDHVSIVTLEGIMKVLPGDWIIRGIKGEFYPIKPDIFEQIYEPVPDPNLIYPGKDLTNTFPEEEGNSD